MQTGNLNVNNTKSDHANAIFRQFQDAIFSREHTSVKTSTKIIFYLLQWQEIATLSLRKKSAIASFISTTFRGHFCLGGNDIARNRSRVIFCRACVDIFRRWRFNRISCFRTGNISRRTRLNFLARSLWRRLLTSLWLQRQHGLLQLCRRNGTRLCWRRILLIRTHDSQNWTTLHILLRFIYWLMSSHGIMNRTWVWISALLSA